MSLNWLPWMLSSLRKQGAKPWKGPVKATEPVFPPQPPPADDKLESFLERQGRAVGLELGGLNPAVVGAVRSLAHEREALKARQRYARGNMSRRFQHED